MEINRMYLWCLSVFVLFCFVSGLLLCFAAVSQVTSGTTAETQSFDSKVTTATPPDPLLPDNSRSTLTSTTTNSATDTTLSAPSGATTGPPSGSTTTTSLLSGTTTTSLPSDTTTSLVTGEPQPPTAERTTEMTTMGGEGQKSRPLSSGTLKLSHTLAG